MTGSESTESVRIPERRLTSKPQKTTKNVRPNKPKTIEGTPARFAIERRVSVTQADDPPYSCRYTALATPSGSAITRAPAERKKVPTRQGQMPPSLIMLRGGSVRNSQLRAGRDSTKMSPRMASSVAMLMIAAARMKPKPHFCVKKRAPLFL